MGSLIHNYDFREARIKKKKLMAGVKQISITELYNLINQVIFTAIYCIIGYIIWHTKTSDR